MPLPWWAMVPQTKNTAISSSPWLWTEVIHFSSYADCLCPFCYNRELPNTRHELCAQPPLKEASRGPFVNQLRQHSAVRRVNFRKATISYAVFFYFFFPYFFLHSHMRHPQSLKVPVSPSWRKDIFICLFALSQFPPSEYSWSPELSSGYSAINTAQNFHSGWNWVITDSDNVRRQKAWYFRSIVPDLSFKK